MLAFMTGLKKFSEAAPNSDANLFTLRLLGLLFSATNQALKTFGVDDELRQAVMLKVTEFSFDIIVPGPQPDPEVIKSKRELYDELLKGERVWSDAWQDAVNAGLRYEDYIEYMGRLFGVVIAKACSVEDHDPFQSIASDALWESDYGKFAEAIVNGNRALLLSYTQTRFGRFL